MKPASIGIVQNCSGDVLLVERSDTKLWVLPGGGIDPGEHPEDACVREIYEEAGIISTIKRHAAVFTPNNRFTSTTYIFICNTENVHSVHADGIECLSARFFPLNNLPKNFFQIHKKWLFECIAATDCIQRQQCEVTFYSCASFIICHPLTVLSYLRTRLKGKISGK